MLHSIATGNMLPASMTVVASTSSHGHQARRSREFQTVGIVTDVELFLRELLSELGLPVC